MKMLRQILGPLLALLLTFGSVVEVSAPVTVAAAGVMLGLGHAQAATPAQKAVVLNGVPGWVLRASGTLPSIDMDFAHNRAWVGGSGPRAPPSLLTTTRASTGYAQWADGHVSLFAANVPRITDLGLLVEQAATNLALQSQTLDNATWVKTTCTVGANSATAPDGTLTADSNIPNNGSNGNAIGQASLTVVASSVYTYSADFKYNAALGLPWVELTTTGDATRRGWFNTQTGAIGTVSDYTSATTTALGNGFFRFTVTFTAASSTGSETLYASSRPSNGSFGSVTGDGVTPAFYEWGVQFELGSAASSYIPTTTVAVARAADVISLTGAALTAALAAKAAYVQSNLVAGGTLPRLLHYSGGAFMDYASSTTTLISNATNTATATMGSGTYTGPVHNSYGMGPASITAISNNGTKATSANAWAANTGTVYVGSNNGSNALNGYMPRLALGAAFGQFDGVSQ